MAGNGSRRLSQMRCCSAAKAHPKSRIQALRSVLAFNSPKRRKRWLEDRPLGKNPKKSKRPVGAAREVSMKPVCILLAVATIAATPAYAADTHTITIGFRSEEHTSE